MSTLISQSIESSDSGDHTGQNPARKRLLLISYHFPPVGGAGVQRPVKFVKYLRQFGWDVSVLMAANPSVPVFDNSLLDDIPEDTHLVKARTWEPDYALKKNMATQNQTAHSTSSLSGYSPDPGFHYRDVVLRHLLTCDFHFVWYWIELRDGSYLS